MENRKIEQNILSAGSLRDYRLDLIKAISICFVFVWHLRPLRPEYAIAKQVVSVLMPGICLVAVPSFITVSLILFYKKYNTGEPGYLKKRMIRLFNIFVFWLIIQNIVYMVVQKEIPPFSFELIFSGGPGIPIAGASVFYFLTALIVLTYAFHLFIHLSDRTRLGLSLIIVIGTFGYFLASSTVGFRLPAPLGFGPYNYLLSFAVYVPLSYYLATNMDYFVKYRYAILLLYIASIVYERVMRIVFELKIFAPYSRISIFWGVVLLFALVFNYRLKERSEVIALSKYSLGIFAVHNYFKIVSYRIYEYINMKWLHYDSGQSIQYPFIFVLTVMFTGLFIYYVKKTWMKRYLS